MPKKMLIDATHAEETRVVVIDGNKVDEFDFEALNKRQLAGNIYLAKITRVEPSLQAAFLDYGGNRHGFLAFSEIHPDYYQIPAEDRKKLLDEEAEHARAQAEYEEYQNSKPVVKAADEGTPAIEDAVIVEDVPDEQPEIGDEAEPAIAEDVSEQPVAETDAPETETSDAESAVEPEAVQQDEPEQPAEMREPVRRKPRARRYKIQEVIKVRQILLVQVVKEERGNKGAAVTTYLSLAGRYCVLMPNTARGGGISRKITNASDRKKLKEIAASIHVPTGAGLIVRTAGAQRTKTEIKRDYEYLLRQWEVVKELTMKSSAPAPIYEEGSLIKRSIRDLYNKQIDEIFVEGERGYREAKDYMKMLMPSHSKNVKHYKEPLPLFSRYQVEGFLAAMFNPTVQLKSGGYIVIGITEALVAIDVNSGRATKEKSIEDTATKTNLEAAEEVARQLRLRDLAGLIVIDFIDMDERRNNIAVEKRMKDRIKNDRARIQIGRISSFGLMEMSRQRLRPGMLEASTQPCQHCHGTGITRSNDSMALAILRELEEEGVKRRAREVLVTAPIEVANYMHNAKREHIAMIESRFGISIRIDADISLISPEYRVERFKTATRIVPIPESLPTIEMPEMPPMEAGDGHNPDPSPEEPEVETNEETPAPKKRRRRRRSRKKPGDAPNDQSTEETQDTSADSAPVEATEPKAETEKPTRKRSRTRKRPAKKVEAATPMDVVGEETKAPEIVEVPESAAPAKVVKKRITAKAPVSEPVEAETPNDPAATAEEPKKPAAKRSWWSRKPSE